MAGPRNRNWIWFFAVLAFLALAAIGISTAYNLRQQLRPETLAAARALWKENGPRSYVLEYNKTIYTKTINAPETFVVEVRNGKTVSVVMYSGEGATGRGLPLEPRLYPKYGMNALFDDMERFLEIDAEPGKPRAFFHAEFDPNDGHLLKYVHSVSATEHRVQIEIKRLEKKGDGRL